MISSMNRTGSTRLVSPLVCVLLTLLGDLLRPRRSTRVSALIERRGPDPAAAYRRSRIDRVTAALISLD
jgi:hypothetical protein